MGKVGRYGDLTVELLEKEKREEETSPDCLDRLLRELLELRSKPTVFQEPAQAIEEKEANNRE